MFLPKKDLGDIRKTQTRTTLKNMPYVQIEGLKIYYIEKGNGPETILLIHGNVSSTEYWDKFLNLLPSQYRAVAFDLRGCGLTEHPPNGYNIPQFVEDVNQFTSQLKLTRFHLLGHSMGGMTSMLFTLKHPEEVQTLALLDSVPANGLFLNDEVRSYFRVIMKDRGTLRQIMEQMVVPFGEGPSFLERATEIAAVCAPQTFIENPESMHQTNFISELSQITAPTLIIHGKDDAVIPLEFMVPTMKAIVQAQVVIFTRCGHSPQVERPKEFSDIYLRFIGDHKIEVKRDL
jgi:pimeloyl-ACP methyl ester carboxylesterase